MATRERVAWIFHEKARRLHSGRGGGKAGLHVVLGRGILRERDRKEGGPALCGAAARPPARAWSQVRRSTAPNGDAVRGTGKRGPRFRVPFCGTSSFEGGPARNRVVFINSRRERGKKGLPSESCGADDLALCLQLFTAAKCEGREAPSEGLPLMKTSRFLASFPSISATEVRGNSACAGERTCRAEQRRAGRNARSTGRSRLRVRVGPCKRRG